MVLDDDVMIPTDEAEVQVETTQDAGPAPLNIVWPVRDPTMAASRRTLQYLPESGRFDHDYVIGYVPYDEVEIVRQYRGTDRRSLVLPQVGEHRTLTWEDLDKKGRTPMEEVVRNYMVESANHVSFFPIHSRGWYSRLTAMRIEAGPLDIEGEWPVMLRYRPAEEEVAGYRAVTPAYINLGSRIHSEWNGLSPLATHFIEARMTEYGEALARVQPEALLAHTFMSATMPIHTARYFPAQEARLSIAALGAPDLHTWRDLLTGSITESFSYIIADQALRYSEELCRLRMYTLAQREAEHDRAEAAFTHVLQVLRGRDHAAYELLDAAVRRWANTSAYSILDDYAAATEQLCHVVTMRRQGFLGAMPHDDNVYRRALGTSFLDQATILP